MHYAVFTKVRESPIGWVHWRLTDFGQSCTLLMEIAFAFIVLCESSGINRQTVKLTGCQRDRMTGGRMPEHNTSDDGRIIIGDCHERFVSFQAFYWPWYLKVLSIIGMIT